MVRGCEQGRLRSVVEVCGVAAPGKHSAFVIEEAHPLNGGVPADRLVTTPITPVDQFFVRNHGTVPDIRPETYRLFVRGLVNTPLVFTLRGLRQRFRSVTVEAALECAGNRRSELMTLEPIPGELPWGAQAVGNAEWTGVRLADILDDAGITVDAQHVEFTGLDDVVKGRDRFGFGGSIPQDKATSSDVLLALEMNGRPLAAEHGFPVRVLVPGYIGARSVKWLGEITVRADPSDNYFQARAYKWFPPHVRADSVNWESGRMLGPIPVTAAIATPADGATVRAGPVALRGYAVSGAGRITAVEVSADGGRTWTGAERHGRPSPWSWCLWAAEVVLPAGPHELVVRAVDEAGNTQPADMRGVWNFKGYVNNAWHRVRVTAGA